MASTNKQQKRAKRAKAKAKQIRVGRTKPAVTLDLPEYEDPSFLNALQEETEGGPKDFLALFYQMHDAEEEGEGSVDMIVRMLGLLLAMVNEQPQLLDRENAENEADAVHHLALDTLIRYRMWADDIDQNAAERWLQSPEVQEDFATAKATFKEILKILWDLEDGNE